MLLSFDIGTTGNKAALVDPQTGAVLDTATAAYSTSYTPGGRAEQNPADWWQSVAAACRELIDRRPAEMARVDAVGCSGMMNGVVLVDAKGGALRPSIIHADTRSAPQCRALEASLGRDAIFDVTSNRPDPHLTLPKMIWLAEHEPETLARTSFVIQAKDYIVGRLTNCWGLTDPSDASLTGAFDVRKRRWATDLWQAAGLATDLLPQAVPSTQIVGHLTPEAAAWTGMQVGIPIVMGGGDGACATAGSGVAHGGAYCVLGGTAWIGLRQDAPINDSRLSAYCSLDETITAFGTVQSAGSALAWFASLIGAPPHAVLDRAASGIAPGADNLFFLPYLQGERAPLWDADARGVYFGLASHHGWPEMYRAVLEGVGFALRSILDVFAENNAPIPALRLLGGGASSPVWRGILTNIFARSTETVIDTSAATSLGAALAAGVGCGLYASWEAALAFVAVNTPSGPDSVLAALYEPRRAFYASLYPLMQERFAALASL